MSVESWKKEFFPGSVRDTKTQADAVRQSLQKFIGARPENLRAHGVRLSQEIGGVPVIISAERIPLGLLNSDPAMSFRFSESTCALCYHNEACATCPIVLKLGHECDYSGDDDLPDSDRYSTMGPYRMFVESGDPEPMIECLQGILARMERKNGEEKTAQK